MPSGNLLCKEFRRACRRWLHALYATIDGAMYQHSRVSPILRMLTACALLTCASLCAPSTRATAVGRIAPSAIVVTALGTPSASSARGVLWQVSPDGAAQRLLATSPGAVPGMPARSPDGAQLAYILDGRSLWQFDAGSSVAHQLYAVPNGSYQRLLSPRYQGKALTFTAGCCANFAIYRLRTQRVEQLASGGLRVLQDWSPDGKHMLYTVNGSLWEADADGAHARPVGNDAAGAGFFSDVRYSPDGTHLVATLIPAQGAGEGSTQELVLLHPDGQYLTVLTATLPYEVSSPTWSPDGKRIAFVVASGALAEQGRLHDLWLMRYNGADKRNLTHGRLGDVTGAIWGR